MEKETYKEIEKIADNIQAEAGRKRCREIENVNSFYDGYIQGIEVCEKLAECEDKEEPKKVIKICTVVSNEKYECPKCGNYLTESDVFAGYCKWCGQKITMEGKQMEDKTCKICKDK